LKEFNKQLESQFNVQCRIVDYLKDELKKTQDALGQKCQKFDEATLTKFRLQQQIEDINQSQKQFHAKVDQNLCKVEAGYSMKLENGVDFSKQLTRLMQSAADHSSSRQQILTNIGKLRQFIDERQQFDAKEQLDALTVLLQRVYDLQSSNRRDGLAAAQSLHISLDESEEKSMQPAVHRWTDGSQTLQQILQSIKAAAAEGDCQSLLPALISSIESQLANESPAVSSPSSGFSGSLDSPQENGITLVLDGRTVAANGADDASDA